MNPSMITSMNQKQICKWELNLIEVAKLKSEIKRMHTIQKRLRGHHVRKACHGKTIVSTSVKNIDLVT